MNRSSALTLLIVFSLAQIAVAQTEKTAPPITYEEIAGKKNIRELFLVPPDSNSVVESYKATLACDGREVISVDCTGEALCPEFFKAVEQLKPARCLYYFDKIKLKTISGMVVDAPGFVLEMKKGK